ncbi:MAG: ParB/RepB/Spo0J family partition protein [Pseudomonadales bacterium]|nr:ParB/RepB/Spo0J family partition protein [Pseudomonadales bacterium]
MAGKKKGLGKGLDALLGGINPPPSRVVEPAQASAQNLSDVSDVATQQAPASDRVAGDRSSGDGDSRANKRAVASIEPNRPSPHAVVQVPVEQCQRGEFQPRRAIDGEGLEELAASIKSQGVMQPIILRELAPGSSSAARYEIVAGERRWRASQLAGLTRVPAIVRELDDEAAGAMALIENLQREDLNAMDQAHALARLAEQFDLTHQQIADLVGKSRAAVSNHLRLLGLHAKVQQLLENGDLEMGHARALLALGRDSQYKLARDVANRCLTVRQTEALVKKQLNPAKRKKAGGAAAEGPDANIERLQNDLAEKLGVPVQVKHRAGGGGQLLLKYHSLDELDGILAHIK